MNHSSNCGKNVWKKSWTKKQRQGLWVARAKWNLFNHTTFMQRRISCQSRFSQSSRERNVIHTLRSMRNDKDFDSFFKVVKKATDPIKPAGKLILPKKRKKPNYSILQYVTGYEGSESNAYHPETAHDYFQPIYFQALDAIISAINDLF